MRVHVRAGAEADYGAAAGGGAVTGGYLPDAPGREPAAARKGV